MTITTLLDYLKNRAETHNQASRVTLAGLLDHDPLNAAYVVESHVIDALEDAITAEIAATIARIIESEPHPDRWPTGTTQAGQRYRNALKRIDREALRVARGGVRYSDPAKAHGQLVRAEMWVRFLDRSNSILPKTIEPEPIVHPTPPKA